MILEQRNRCGLFYQLDWSVYQDIKAHIGFQQYWLKAVLNSSTEYYCVALTDQPGASLLYPKWMAKCLTLRVTKSALEQLSLYSTAKRHLAQISCGMRMNLAFFVQSLMAMSLTLEVSVICYMPGERCFELFFLHYFSLSGYVFCRRLANTDWHCKPYSMKKNPAKILAYVFLQVA